MRRPQKNTEEVIIYSSFAEKSPGKKAVILEWQKMSKFEPLLSRGWILKFWLMTFTLIKMISNASQVIVRETTLYELKIKTCLFQKNICPFIIAEFGPSYSLCLWRWRRRRGRGRRCVPYCRWEEKHLLQSSQPAYVTDTATRMFGMYSKNIFDTTIK